MLTFATWAAVGFLSGSIPWALLLGRTFLGKDIRGVGDANPGVANLWKLGGWVLGSLSLVLETAKSCAPAYFAVRYLGEPNGVTQQLGLALVVLAPVVGHGWSPFLRFRGGKALAATLGSWMAITNGIALPVACIFLVLMHGLQRNHAITVTFTLLGLLAVFLPMTLQLYVALFGFGNLAIVVCKHWNEYSIGFIPRGWVTKFARLAN